MVSVVVGGGDGVAVAGERRGSATKKRSSACKIITSIVFVESFF